jgi:hypothetical protein
MVESRQHCVMRIGVMLRDLDQKGGTGVYTRHLMEALLRLYTENDYSIE